MKEIFNGIFRSEKKLYTKNLVPGARVYGEKLVNLAGTEYREWDPRRSKLAAAILNGLKNVPIKSGSLILYLGISAGTTASHISDIIGKDGLIYGIEISERMMRELMPVAEKRSNIVPILSDARKPEEYFWIEKVDLIYVDVADPQEMEIFIRNAEKFLKSGGFGMIAIKSQSIDVTKSPEVVYKQETTKLKRAGFTILEQIELSPYQGGHAFVLVEKC
ncbi:MAG: fibrillarin-like rRNA/tRNA 2'-O-methyltransferase [Candidatus Aenigmarchaeota archaeon]|nr:fibrillarin-like rRNA/tRNA 2'-O-methyltransferase [Candidatus Aenigmarchaeota archaeon]